MIKRTFLAILSVASSLLAESLENPVLQIEETPLEAFNDSIEFKVPSGITEQVNLQEPQPSVVFMQPSYKSPLLATGLSLLVPGLGHVYLDNLKTAGGIFGSACLGVGLGAGNIAFSTAKPGSWRREWGNLTVETAWTYGIYAAYRDARKNNGQAGYLYEMPNDSFADLAYAPFNFSVLKKPEVWGGLIGSLAAATAVLYFGFPDEARIAPALCLQKTVYPLTAFPVGISEEALCRGVLLPQLSEWFSPWGGIVLSSLIFGALHIPNAQNMEPQERKSYYTFSIPFITLSGIYDGWLTYKNCSLKESTALHAWYDFVLFATFSLATQSIGKGRADFAIAIPF